MWYLFFTIATFISLSDLGIPTAFGRAVSYVWGGRQAGRPLVASEIPSFYHDIPVHELYTAALTASLIMGAAVALLGFPLSYVYLSSIVSSPVLLDKITLALVIFLIGVVLNLISAVPYACISGYGDVGIDNGTRTAIQVIGFAATAALLPLYPDIRILSSMYLIQGAFTLLAGHYLLHKRYGLPLGFSKTIHLPAARRLYSEAFPVFITRIGLWMIIESNLLIAGYFLSASSIPDFAILRQLVMMGMTIPTAIPLTLAPYAAAAYAAGDEAKVRHLYLTAVRYSLIITSVWTVGLLLWTPYVMELWVGKGHFLGYAVLLPIVINCFLELHASAHGFFAWSAGKWPFAPVTIIGGALNIIFASIGCWQYSYAGLAWGTLLSQIATGYWYGVYYTLGLLRVELKIYLRDIMLPILVYMVLLLAFSGSIRLLGPSIAHRYLGTGLTSFSSLFMLTITGIAVTLGIALILAFILILKKNDRENIRQLLRHGFSKG